MSFDTMLSIAVVAFAGSVALNIYSGIAAALKGY